MAARRALQWAARHDPLTGLANRHAFEERLKRIFRAMTDSQPVALAIFDLDRFKPINDTHGHAAGDAMLRAVASVATSRVRHGDLLARLGGDEFALILERCSAEAAMQAAEELCGAVSSRRLTWGQELLQVGVSIGVSPLHDRIPSPEAWIDLADRACYAAKGAGRGAVVMAREPDRGVSGAPVMRLVDTRRPRGRS